MIYNFNTKQNPALNEIGGKAKNLITTTQAGLSVPGGLTLSVAFFQEWTLAIKESSKWKALIADPTRKNCDAVQNPK